jgi:uncharacterized membrane protein
MGLGILVLGLLIFHTNHLFVTMRDARAAMIARLGLPLYRVLFSVVSTVGLILIVWGYTTYRASEWIDIWNPPAVMRHITVGLMLIAVILLTAYFMPSHIKAWTKYPALAAIKIWAFAHLLANGDLGSILLFGSFLAWAVYARISAKRRTDVELPKAPTGWSNDIVVVAIGILLYLALGYAFHPIVIGVPVFGHA